MTVQSLWKILDEAGCSQKVGSKNLFDFQSNKKNKSRFRAPPLQQNADSSSFEKSLAVDLSIWICEALTSHALNEGHAKPWLHLAFSRATKLLSLGIRLVIVIEGKRRINNNDDGSDSFRKRRSGTLFWKACNECEELLRHLGIPVVKAKAEGEALCALLNQNGIVDGVISNDGDCFLFGAKVLYTKFSVENLEKGEVHRYRICDFSANVEVNNSSNVETIRLSREDLIAFAILTGSDMAGPGLQNVGSKRALRYIRKCHTLRPNRQDAALQDVLSWCKSNNEINNPGQEPGKKCSCCNHPGTKSLHQKHGCEKCGTSPGQPCILEDSDDKLRKSLQEKASSMQSFHPVRVSESYQQPNENQIPLSLTSKIRPIARMPDLGSLMEMKLIVKGHSLSESREYLKKIVGRIMALIDLHDFDSDDDNQNNQHELSMNRSRPIPVEIVKVATQNGKACYDVTWRVPATLTDDYGQEIGGYEYSTISPRDIFKTKYPQLVEAFERKEKERKKQKNAEEIRRITFLDSMLRPDKGAPDTMHGTKNPDFSRRREYFELVQPSQSQRIRRKTFSSQGADAKMLLGFAPGKRPATNKRTRPVQSLEDYHNPPPKKVARDSMRSTRPFVMMGGFEIVITPLKSAA